VHDAGGSAQVRRPRQARDHSIGTRLVKDHAKLPRERHERDQFIRVSWHEGRLPATSRARAALSSVILSAQSSGRR
jgi:hypothetical protein